MARPLFDKRLQVRMGQANVWRWVEDVLPLLTDDDPPGVDSFKTHARPLEDAPARSPYIYGHSAHMRHMRVRCGA